MTFPGPPALGRGVVVGPGQAAPAPWAGARRIVVDDDALGSPGGVVGALHSAWARREAVVVELACDPGPLRQPEVCTEPVWSLAPAFEFERERLQFLVWANTYDGREGEPVWWHARRAQRLLGGRGVGEGGPADLVGPGGTPVWVDGGPFAPPPVGDAEVLHRWSVESGDVRFVAHERSKAALADDQRAAVEHGSGAARVIAPAGSGKTRVLTERLTHLLQDRGAAPPSVMAVAFNEKAAEELRARTGLSKAGDGVQVRTLNSLGLWVCTEFGRRRLEVLGDERQVRDLVEQVFEIRRKANADTVAPYIDALSAVRLGLAPPGKVEDALPDAAGLAEGFDRYRQALAGANALDFDEQIYRAVEILLTDPSARREAQARCRTMLVDEFQDLHPAHLLLIRLLCAPALDCFAVGDDDQVIYGYSGATPEYLLGFDRYFPDAGAHALEVNYRCPPAVVAGARNLLSHNDERIAKTIRPREGASDELPAFSGPLEGLGPVVVTGAPAEAMSGRARDVLASWSSAGVGHAEMAVLARVNSVLLPLQVDLTAAGVPCTRPLGPKVLERTGIRAGLAYLRIGLAPGAIHRRDIELTVRRPSRGIAKNVVEMLLERPTTSLAAIRGLAGRLSGRDGPKVSEYADAIEHVARLCQGSTLEALRGIRLEVGLGATMDALDSSRKEADKSTHLDDLVALESVAGLHPDVEGFEAWLRTQLSSPEPEGPVVLLSSIHKIKGREWDYVVVYGVSEGTMPHRLSEDEEGERRIFHVALTRAKRQVVVLADAAAPSAFVGELGRSRPAGQVSSRGRSSRVTRERHGAPPRAQGRGVRAPASEPERREADGLEAALRAWRAEAARRAGIRAFLVLHDKHLESVAQRDPHSLAELARCAGIGPMKLERWGDEILAALAAARGGRPAEPVVGPGAPTSAD